MAARVERTESPLVVIIGPTASGKTALAVKLAQQINGEVICADSRTVFREMNIGTAKPTAEDQQGVPHWGVDLVTPGERFTAAEFQRYANDKIAEITRRGRTAIVVGGTGLYVDGLVFDYRYPREAPADLRAVLEGLSTEELYKYCVENNIELPINDKNKRHLIRSIAHDGVEERRNNRLRPNTVVFGIAVDKATLTKRIAHRTEQMFSQGVVEEAKMLGKKYGWESEAMTGNIYPLLKEYLQGERSLDHVKSAFESRDWQLAKRQMTWFRRNAEILWGTTEDIEEQIMRTLAT